MMKPTTARRPRFKFAVLAAALLAISGCTETGNSNVVVPQEAVDQFRNIHPKKLMPLAHPKTFLASFDRYCANNVGKPARIKAQLRADGYIPLVHISSEMTVYAHQKGKPLVALGRKAGSPDMCMIMSRKHSALRPAVNAYITRKHGGNVINLPNNTGKAEQAWMVGGSSPKIYITLTKKDPVLGLLYAFAVGKVK